MSCFNRSILLAVPVVAVLGAPVHAQAPDEIERRLSVRAGVASTDNLGREPSHSRPERTTFATVGVDIGAERQNRRVSGFIDGSLDYHRYDSTRFSNETLGGIDGQLDVGIVPARLDWRFTNQLGHVRREPIHAAAPGNRERLNVFSTGPRAILPLGDRDNLVLSGQYADRRWQESSHLDGAGHSADVSWLRALRPNQHFGITAGTRRVDYDLDEHGSHDVDAAFFTYARGLSVSSLEFRAGWNRLRFQGEETTKPYLSASLERQLTPRSMLSVGAATRYEDSTAQLSDRPVLRGGLRGMAAALRDVGGDLGHVARTSNPLARTSVGAAYTLTRPRAVVSVGSDWSRERFEGAARLDRDGLRSAASLDYQFAPGLRGHIDGFRTRERFVDEGERANETGIAAGISRQLSRTLAVTFRYQRYERQYARRDDFAESRYTVWLVWLPV